MITETEAYGRKTTDKMSLFNTYKNIPTSLTLGPPYISVLKSYGANRSLFLLSGKKGFGEAILIRSGIILIGKKHVETRRKLKMKNDRLSGPGNITKGLSISDVNDGNSIISSPIDISPRIHPVDQAIAKQRKNAKRNDKNLWRFTLILK
jgi:3-methyladenine DNA glycosylase Mpg